MYDIVKKNNFACILQDQNIIFSPKCIHCHVVVTIENNFRKCIYSIIDFPERKEKRQGSPEKEKGEWSSGADHEPEQVCGACEEEE